MGEPAVVSGGKNGTKRCPFTVLVKRQFPAKEPKEEEERGGGDAWRKSREV